MSINPDERSVTTANGSTSTADFLVIAALAQPNSLGMPGASEHTFPMYSLNDAERLRSHILAVLDAAIERPELVEQGAMSFVIVGGGTTGVESAGALAEVLASVLPMRYEGLAKASAVHIVDLGHVLLAPFSDRAHAYAAKRMEHDGVIVHLGVGVKEAQADRVVLSDGSEIMTRTIIWGGGEQAADVVGSAGLPQGRGGRIDVQRDLTVTGHPRVYVLGDAASARGRGPPFAAWLGVHAMLMSGARNRVDAFIAWGQGLLLHEPGHRVDRQARCRDDRLGRRRG